MQNANLLPDTRSSIRFNITLTAMPAILFVMGIASVLWGERNPINNGFGWDGRIYGAAAKALDFRSLEPYYFDRTFPSALVRYGILVFRQPRTDHNVVMGFEYLNLFALLLSCVFFMLTSRELGLTRKSSCIGFLALFVNFSSFKMCWFDPVSTDAAALTLSLALL